MAFTTLVRPHLEYPSIVWDPYYKQDIQSLEKIQRKVHVARFVTGDYSYQHSVTTMLDHLNWPSLEHRRKNKRLTTFYKICNNSNTVTQIYLIMSKPSTVKQDPMIRATSRSKQTMSNTRTASYHVPSENGIAYLLTWYTPSL